MFNITRPGVGEGEGVSVAVADGTIVGVSAVGVEIVCVSEAGDDETSVVIGFLTPQDASPNTSISKSICLNFCIICFPFMNREQGRL